MDCSPPGSSVHGIFQARALEWGAIAFSDYLRQKCLNGDQGNPIMVLLLLLLLSHFSHVRLCATP